MAEVRFYNADDARRDRAIAAVKRHIRAAGITTDYDPDIEYLGDALVAFADEWAAGERVKEARDGE